MMIEHLYFMTNDGCLWAIDIVAKSSLLLVLAAIACWLLRGRSSALRHRIWSFALFGSIALPAVSMVGPQIRIPMLAQKTTEQAASHSSSAMMDREPPRVLESVYAGIVDQSGQPVAKAIVSADVVHELRGSTWQKMSSSTSFSLAPMRS